MQRTSLILMLIISTLLGQSFCCCTSMALFGKATDNSSRAEACCCTQAGNSGECPNGSNKLPHECPCKKNKAVSARLDSDVSLASAFVVDFWATRSACETFVSWSPAPVHIAVHFDSSTFPHLDRAGILRAVNSLRC
jgi:hypothetical protein